MSTVLFLPYTNGVPGLNATKTLFDSSIADQLGGGRPMQSLGLKRYKVSLSIDQACTLKAYAKANPSDSWVQFATRRVLPPPVGELANVVFNLDQHRYVKVDLVNGPAQAATFYAGQALTDDASDAGAGSDYATYIVNGDMAADIEGPAIQVGPLGLVTLFIQTTATDNPDGRLLVKGTFDGSSFVELTSYASKFPASGVLAAQNIAVELTDLNVDQVKLCWDNAADGTGALLNAQARSR